jgi:hypothetical protein
VRSLALAALFFGLVCLVVAPGEDFLLNVGAGLVLLLGASSTPGRGGFQGRSPSFG